MCRERGRSGSRNCETFGEAFLSGEGLLSFSLAPVPPSLEFSPLRYLHPNLFPTLVSRLSQVFLLWLPCPLSRSPPFSSFPPSSSFLSPKQQPTSTSPPPTSPLAGPRAITASPSRHLRRERPRPCVLPQSTPSRTASDISGRHRSATATPGELALIRNLCDCAKRKRRQPEGGEGCNENKRITDTPPPSLLLRHAATRPSARDLRRESTAGSPRG